MPSRDVRDEMQATDPMAPPMDAPEVQPLPELQLKLRGAQQRAAVQLVLADFHAAEDARNRREFGYGQRQEKLDFDAWVKELKDLYYGHRIAKTEPWKFCSNRSMMIAMTIVETLHARIFPAVYNVELTHWRPVELTDEGVAERVTKLMFWWVRVRSRLREFFDRWTRYAIWAGWVVTESQFEVQYQVGRPRQVPTAAPMGPAGAIPQAPESELLPQFRTRTDLYPIEDVFLQEGATDIQRDPVILRMRWLYRDLEAMERNGQAINGSVASDAGLQSLKELLPVEAVPESLPQEEAETLRDIKRRNKPVIVLKWHGAADLDGDGVPEPVRLLVDPERQVYLGGIAVQDLSKRGMRHLDVTQFLPRVDEPHGLWGLGVIEQIKHHAFEIDAIFNQLTDANSLSVLQPGFYDPSGDLDAPALKIKPGVLTPVTNPQGSIYFPQINIPTERLILAIRLVLEFIERLTAASAYILGKESEIVGGSGTATRTQEIIGAANQRFSIPIQRLRDGAARIMTQHLDLVQTHIDEMPELERRVLGEKGQPIFGPNELTGAGLSGEFDAYLLPDESMGSKDLERTLAQQLYAVLTSNLIVMSDPAKLYKVTADVLKSWGKNPEAYLGPEPPIAGTLSPEDEHTLILEGRVGELQATVTQNPIEHLLKHQAFLQDPRLAQLHPALQLEIQQAMAAHMQQHQQILTLVSAASQRPQGGPSQPGGENGNLGGRTPARGGPTAAPVGPEPGMGAVQNPLARTRQIQRGGESRGPTI